MLLYSNNKNDCTRRGFIWIYIYFKNSIRVSTGTPSPGTHWKQYFMCSRWLAELHLKLTATCIQFITQILCLYRFWPSKLVTLVYVIWHMLALLTIVTQKLSPNRLWNTRSNSKRNTGQQRVPKRLKTRYFIVNIKFVCRALMQCFNQHKKEMATIY